MKKDHADLPARGGAEREVPLPPPAQLREWADEAFKDFGGSRRIFPMLTIQAARCLFAKLRHKAEAQMLLEVGLRRGPGPIRWSKRSRRCLPSNASDASRSS